MENPHLSEDELRRKILANASVLFPSTLAEEHGFEIVYATYPRTPEKKAKAADTPPWQYAILTRKGANGEYEALLKGRAWSTAVPWIYALRGLLDISAGVVHKRFEKAVLPGLERMEGLPEYSPPTEGTSAAASEKGIISEVEEGVS